MNSIKCTFISENLQETREYISSLELNLNLEDQWSLLKPNSVGSYTKAFFRIKTKENTTKYYILDNVFITYINNEINITYRGCFRSYLQIKKSNDFIMQNEAKLKTLLTDLNYYKSCKQLSVDNLNKIAIYKLENEIFILKAITLFNLNPEESKCAEN
ncbi:MSC_0621 family F1-like ATPase epsilon subunit [Mycoplasma sp. SK341A]|uniref:MSC_0621 family F1-like ATPase epsilon subunit n=1 Tax=Mycoplasma sp. SK341A TaxID=3401679 RepID=UPI003AAEF09E